MEHHPLPRFSDAERIRRWERVRELMSLAGVDVLVAVDEPNSRYLTGDGSATGPTVFTADGEITALCELAADAEEGWVGDVRPAPGRETEGLIDRLGELGADRRIVAVTGLDPTPRRPRGNLNYLTFIAMREWFPHTRWVGASQLMDEARWQKSGEEISTIEAAAACAEAALRAAAETASASGSVRELWGEMFRAAVARGGDPTGHITIATDPTGDRSDANRRLDRPVALAHLVEAEVLARVHGYGARGTQPILQGQAERMVDQAWSELADLWDQVWDQLRPGRTLGEVVAAAPFLDQPHLSIQLDGMGLGEDLPYLGSQETTSRELRERPLVEGVCFALELTVTWKGADRPRRVRWADTVVITPNGARRLGARPLALITVL